MQVLPSPLGLSFTSGCTSKRSYTRSVTTYSGFSIASPKLKSIRKATYAGTDECKLSWLIFRGHLSEGGSPK